MSIQNIFYLELVFKKNMHIYSINLTFNIGRFITTIPFLYVLDNFKNILFRVIHIKDDIY